MNCQLFIYFILCAHMSESRMRLMTVMSSPSFRNLTEDSVEEMIVEEHPSTPSLSLSLS